jgi:aerobic carbon-monoxide dehydrogenase medium subunit
VSPNRVRYIPRQGAAFTRKGDFWALRGDLTKSSSFCVNRPMLLREVEYARPSSLDEALRILGSNDGARALAGGQTLINVMKSRAASPDVLVDLAGLTDLTAVSTGAGGLELGAMVTYAQLASSSEVEVTRPILGEVAATIADVQVRNRGTIGGNICSNDPTNHLPPLLVALEATMTIVGPDGERTVSAGDFFLGVYMTAVATGELLTKVTIPPPGGAGDGFAALTIGTDGTCIVSAAASVANGASRIAIGCVSATPVRATGMEAKLGGDFGEASVREAAKGLGAELDPPGDVHASADYRRHLAEVMAVRAVLQAAAGARA